MYIYIVCIYIYIQCIYIYIYVYIYIQCVYIYIYIYTVYVYTVCINIYLYIQYVYIYIATIVKNEPSIGGAMGTEARTVATDQSESLQLKLYSCMARASAKRIAP